MKKTLCTFLIFSLLTFLSGCLNRVEKHGYMFDLSDYNLVEKDISSKERVLKLMGSPTLVSNLDSREAWIYYAEEVNYLLFFYPSVKNRKILLLKFDDSEIVRNVEFFDLKNEDQKISFVSKYTAVDGHEEGLIKAIFGNVGQIRPQGQ
jgi:outer membrane protein assembly factor BamE (lipoprotein component of BamABCDE complex)